MKFRVRKTGLVAGVCLAAMSTAAFARATDFDVPAGDMKLALDVYARQSHQQVIYRVSDLDGMTSRGARGDLAPQVALNRILDGAALDVHAGPSGALAIVRKASFPMQKPAPMKAIKAAYVTEAAQAPVSAPEPEEPAAVEAIVVTGSHIVRRDYTANSPIVTIGNEALETTGTATVEDYLNTLPQFVGSTGSGTNAPGNSGQANLDLRGLGRARTLVLLDGHRVIPANSDGSVDVNIIPRSLIDNVEVITGGASAAYGSDAVAGVVNFKLKNNFQGVIYDGQYGITDRGDAKTYDVNATFGGNFADHRGNAVLALSYSKRDPVYGSDRAFPKGWGASSTVEQGTYAAIGTNLPSQAAVNAVFAKYGVAAGSVLRSANLSFNQDGTLFSATGGVQNYKGNNPLNDASGASFLYQAYAANLLQLPLERKSAFGRVTYDLGGGVEAFGQALFSDYSARVLQAAAPAAGNPAASGTGFLIPVTNPFIPADLKTILASRTDPNADFLFNKRLVTSDGRSRTSNYTVYQIISGVRGKLDAIDGGWDITGSYGRNSSSTLIEGSISSSATSQLLRAADGGASLCTGGYNPFGISTLSQSCVDFLNRTATNTQVVEQQGLEANIQGRVAELPAGEMRFAAGVDYRKDSYDFHPDNLVMGGDLIGLVAQFPLSGSTDVREIYGEVLAPILKDLPFIKSFDIDLGYRYSDYSSVGGVSSYKAEGNWQIFNGFGLRGGYQRAVRAPSIGELFAPATRERPTLGTASLTGASGDPCDVKGSYRNGPNAALVRSLCLAQGMPAAIIDTYSYSNSQTYGTTAGNTNLQEETADTYSLGAVWRSRFENPWLSGVSASVDYYNISVKDAVGVIGAATSIRNCFNVAGANPTYANSNSYCQNLTRDTATGDILNVNEQMANLGAIKTSGIDVTLDWRAHLNDLGAPIGGTLGVNLVVSHLDNYKVRELPGGPMVDYAGSIGSTLDSAFPEWKLSTSVSYDLGPVKTSLRWRRIDAMKDRSLIGAAAGATAVSTPTTNYFDFDGRWDVSSVVQLRVGVINIAGHQPPFYTSNVSMNTDPSTYDTLGRRFYVGLKARF